MRLPGRLLLSLVLLLACCGGCTRLSAQDASAVPVAVPHLVQFSGIAAGEPSAPVTLRFALYSVQTGGEPVWSEMQTVTPDAKGRYAVLLGAASEGGLPQAVFSNAEARWLGVTVGLGEEQPRTVLVATPYSLKASDAETLGGHAAGDFVMAPKDASGQPLAGTPVTQINTSSGILGGGTGPTVNLTLDGSYLANYGNAAYAQLHAANTFSAGQTINGNLTVNGTISGSGVVGSLVAGAAVDITHSGGAYTIALDSAQATAFGNGIWAQLGAANTFAATQTFRAPVTFAAGQVFPNTISGITAGFGLTGSASGGVVSLAVNPTALNGTFDARYAQLAAANYFSAANTYVAQQTLAPAANATASAGKDSSALKFQASAWNSTAGGPQSVGYLWQAEPLGNDTASPSATLNLLYQNGTSNAAETGLSVASNGRITFAAGQTFPGAGGGGTITGVTAGAGLTGGGTTGNVTLAVDAAALEGTYDSRYARVATANSFAGTQTISTGDLTVGAGNINLPVTTSANQGVVQQAGSALLQTYGNGNLVLGMGAGNFTTTGYDNAVVGTDALRAVTSGNYDTAVGTAALLDVTTGYSNTAVGGEAALNITVGSYNTAIGANSGGNLSNGIDSTFLGASTGVPSNLGQLQNATAVGYGAIVSQSNAMVLGNGSIDVGIGTSTPAYTLDVHGTGNFTGAVNFAGNQAISGTETITASSTSSTSGSLNVTNGGTGGNAIYATDTNGTAIAATGTNGISATSSVANGFAVAGFGYPGTQVIGGTTYGGTGVYATGYFGLYSNATNYGLTAITSAAGGIGVAAQGDSASGTGVEATGGIGLTATSSVSTNDGTAIVANGGSTFTSNNNGTGLGANGYYAVNATGVGAGVTATAQYALEGFGSIDGVLGEGPNGVVGLTSTAGGGTYGQGLYGTMPSTSVQGSDFVLANSAGAWGDMADNYGAGAGVLATADSNTALIALNDSPYPTMEVDNYTAAANTHYPIFQTNSPNTYSGARHCTIDTSANLTCTGVVSGVVPVRGKQMAMYSMQSPENWFEDFGSGQLNAGKAEVALEGAFGETVNGGVEYHVFLTPKGDCKGLYVGAEGPGGFEVRELGGGTSSVAFDYRIVAKRKGYETVRMEDLTPQADATRARMEERAARIAAAPASARNARQIRPLHPPAPAAARVHASVVRPAIPVMPQVRPPAAGAARAALDSSGR